MRKGGPVGQQFAVVPHMHEFAAVQGLEDALAGKATDADIASAIAAHVAEANPHAQYLTEAEADLLYEPLGGGGGAAPSSATITVPAPGRFEHYETVVDAAVEPTSVINLWLAPALDSDENCSEMLDLTTLSANPGTGSFEVIAAFFERTSGPIKLNYTVS